jgi:hypothetical protein
VNDEVEAGTSCGVFQDGGGSFILNGEWFEEEVQISWSRSGFHCDAELVAGNSSLLKPQIDGGNSFGKGLLGELDGSGDGGFEEGEGFGFGDFRSRRAGFGL